MRIIQAFIYNNDCFKTGQTIEVKGLMIHSVGTPQPAAAVFARQFNSAKPHGRQVAVHAFLQANGDVYQTLPWNHRGWHCGSGPRGSANNTHIGVEMTEPDTIRYTGGSSWIETGNGVNTGNFVQETYRTAVELFAYLCRQFNLDPTLDGVIISHSEGHQRGIASNHGDVEHLWHRLGLTMVQFREDIRTALFEQQTVTTIPIATLIASTPIATENKFCPYLAKVTATQLNIRKGPGTNYPVTGVITDKGTYTVVEEAHGTGATGWGKLKSGAGWISLDYVKKSS